MAKKQVDVKAFIAEKKVLFSRVSRLGHLPDGTAYMEVSVGKQRGIIRAEEADLETERYSLMPLLGRNVAFIALSEEEDGTITCSRKQAQTILRAQRAEALINKEPMNGTVVDTAPFGVFIEVGGISGLLKNADYVNACTHAAELLPVGTKIRVACKSIQQNGKILWEAVDKPEPKPIEYDVIPDTCVTGSVTNIQPFKTGGVGVFVNLQPGIDVLCLLPANMEVNRGNRVALKIVDVEPPKEVGLPPRIRGKLLRVVA